MNWYIKANSSNTLADQSIILRKDIDEAYQNEDFRRAEQLEEQLERINEILESQLNDEEGYDIEGQGEDQTESTSLEEELAYAYHEYINFNRNNTSFNTIDDIIQNMIAALRNHGLTKEINDMQVLELARDSYNRKLDLHNKHKQYKV